MFHRARIVLFLLVMMFGLSILTLLFSHVDLSQNLMFYKNGGIQPYLLHDLERNLTVSTPIDAFRPAFSVDGRVAYRTKDDPIGGLYIWDYRLGREAFHHIMRGKITTPISWSPDGRLLATRASQDNSISLEIWDGENVFAISPSEIPAGSDIWDVQWNQNNQIAFVLGIPVGSNVHTRNVLYVWDGNRTINLSQSVDGDDYGPVWSLDGQLAFLSRTNVGYDILIWDGRFHPDNLSHVVPYLDTFISHASLPKWTPERDVLFLANNPPDSHFQMYKWNGHETVLVTQDVYESNGAIAIHAHGWWASLVGGSQNREVVVRDPENRVLLRTPGDYGPVWSPNVDLFFCNFVRPKWVLLRWDGNKLHEMDTGYQFDVYFQNGARLDCPYTG